MKVYVAMRPVDFRKGIDGLALAVQQMFGLDPFCGAVFVFRAKRADRIKLLVWDQTGMVLVHKRLEGGKFVWPQVRDGVMRMSSAQLAALFEGLDWRLVRPERARRPLVAGCSVGCTRSACFCWPELHQRDSLGAWMPTPSASRTLI